MHAGTAADRARKPVTFERQDMSTPCSNQAKSSEPDTTCGYVCELKLRRHVQVLREKYYGQLMPVLGSIFRRRPSLSQYVGRTLPDMLFGGAFAPQLAQSRRRIPANWA